jgi:hypothetical protein
MRTTVRGPLGPEIKEGVPLKKAVKRQLNIVALTPRITAWGMKSFPRAKKPVIPYPMAIGRLMVAAETAPKKSPLIMVIVRCFSTGFPSTEL